MIYFVGYVITLIQKGYKPLKYTNLTRINWYFFIPISILYAFLHKLFPKIKEIIKTQKQHKNYRIFKKILKKQTLLFIKYPY